MIQEAKRMERKRKHVFNRRKIPLLIGLMYIAIGVTIALVLHFYGADFGMEEKTSGGIGILALLLFFWIGLFRMMPWQGTVTKYERLYKKTLLPKLIPNEVEILSIDVNKGFREAELSFLPLSYDVFVSDFLLKGSYAGWNFDYGRLCLQDTNSSYNGDLIDSSGSSRYSTSHIDLFSGMMLKVNLEKNLDFMIMANNRNLFWQNYNLTDYISGDAAFDRSFSCYTTDDVQFADIITDGVRRELIRASDVSDASLFVSLHQGALWLIYNDMDSEAVIPEDTKITEEYLDSFTKKTQSLLMVAERFLRT